MTVVRHHYLKTLLFQAVLKRLGDERLVVDDQDFPVSYHRPPALLRLGGQHYLRWTNYSTCAAAWAIHNSASQNPDVQKYAEEGKLAASFPSSAFRQFSRCDLVVFA